MGRSAVIIAPEKDADKYTLKVFKTGDENDEGKEFTLPMEKQKEDEKLDLSLVMKNSPIFGMNPDS